MDFLGDVFRATAACASPRSNPLSDILYGLIGFVSTALGLKLNTRSYSRYMVSATQIGLPIWRRSVDAQVVAHREEHRKYCRDKGYVS